MGQTDGQTQDHVIGCASYRPTIQAVSVIEEKPAVASVPCVTSQHFILPYPPPIRHTSSYQPDLQEVRRTLLVERIVFLYLKSRSYVPTKPVYL